MQVFTSEFVFTAIASFKQVKLQNAQVSLNFEEQRIVSSMFGIFDLAPLLLREPQLGYEANIPGHRRLWRRSPEVSMAMKEHNIY